jgi:hypothetical protein
MKKLLTITILLLTISLNAQTKFEQERDSLNALPGMREVFQFQFVKLEVIKELRFAGLQDREKWLLLEKIEDAYFAFHNSRKQVEPSTLLAFMESENPICKWSGLYEEVEENRLIKVYKVDMKIILQIFDL